MASTVRRLAVLVAALATTAAGSPSASIGHGPTSVQTPVAVSRLTRAEWGHLVYCHSQPGPLDYKLEACSLLEHCADERCSVLAALASSADTTKSSIFAGLGVRPPGSGFPPGTGPLAIQSVLLAHPDWRPLALDILVRLARLLEFQNDEQVILALATVIDPTGATQHRMADGLPRTISGDEAILDASEGCYLGTLPACAAIRR